MIVGVSDVEPRGGPGRPRDAGGQVLVWMRDEFEALRRQVHALASSVAQQRAMLSELGGNRVAELATSLAELEGCAAALRNEAARLQSIERNLGDRLAAVVGQAVSQQVGEMSLKGVDTLLQDRLTDVVADAVRPQLRAAIAARLPELINDVVQPQVKAALDELHGCTTELRDEYTRLRALGDDLAGRLPKLVELSVEAAVARQAALFTRAASATRPSAPATAAAPTAVAPAPTAATTPAPTAPAPTVPAPPTPAPPTPALAPASPAPAPAPPATAPPPPARVATPAPAPPAPAATPASAPAAPAPTIPAPATPVPAPAAAAPAPPPPTPVSPSSTKPIARPAAAASAAPPPRPVTRAAPPPAAPAASTSDRPPAPAVADRPPPAPTAAPPRPPSATSPLPADPPPPATSTNGPAPGTVRYAEAASAAAAAADIADGIACVVPGMVAGPSLAVGVAEALGRARLRRRRRRRAAPPAAGLYRRDPFAGHVTRRLERFARGRVASPGAPARALGAAGWATVIVGEVGAAEVGVDLSTTGLVLAGPGAADVARAAVTGLLATQGPSTMAAVVTGDLLPAVPPFPGLAQTAALGPAIDELAAEVDRRVRLLADDGVPDAGAYRTKHPGANFPMIVLAATDVSADDLVRARALFAEGARAGVSGILVAAGEAADAGADTDADVRLAPGAMVEESRLETLAGARLFRMESDVAAELLAVFASARTDGEHMRPVPDDIQSFQPNPSAATAPVAVQLLGVYRIEVDGTEIKSGLRAKAKELLAFYLLHPEGASLDEAVEALWPEADPRRGSEWFWTALGNLRTKLRQATGQKELKVIDRDGDLYRIEDVFDVDLWSLQLALWEGARSRDDAVRQAALDRAVADYDGELLVGLDWFWLETPREDLRQRMVDVLVWLGDRRWAAGDARAAWAALQRALEVDPFAEQIYRRIMRLQGKLSRPDDAEVTYRRLVAKLREVDLAPTPETDKLYAEVCPQA